MAPAAGAAKSVVVRLEVMSWLEVTDSGFLSCFWRIRRGPPGCDRKHLPDTSGGPTGPRLQIPLSADFVIRGEGKIPGIRVPPSIPCPWCATFIRMPPSAETEALPGARLAAALLLSPDKDVGDLPFNGTRRHRLLLPPCLNCVDC